MNDFLLEKIDQLSNIVESLREELVEIVFVNTVQARDRRWELTAAIAAHRVAIDELKSKLIL